MDEPTITAKPCPDCGGRLELGVARVRGTIWGFLTFGLSRQHLWWVGSRGTESVVMRSGTQERARRCERCGVVLIGGATS